MVMPGHRHTHVVEPLGRDLRQVLRTKGLLDRRTRRFLQEVAEVHATLEPADRTMRGRVQSHASIGPHAIDRTGRTGKTGKAHFTTRAHRDPGLQRPVMPREQRLFPGMRFPRDRSRRTRSRIPPPDRHRHPFESTLERTSPLHPDRIPFHGLHPDPARRIPDPRSLQVETHLTGSPGNKSHLERRPEPRRDGEFRRP